MPSVVGERGPVVDATVVSAAPWTRQSLVGLFAITAAAALLRLFRLELWSMGAVEAGTWRLITMPLDGGDGFFSVGESRYPLVFLSLRWLLDVGLLPLQGEGWLRLPFAFVGTLTVPLLALAVGRHCGRGTALTAAALLALHPWHVFVSQSADPVGVSLFVATVALGLAGRAASTARRSPWVAPSLGLVVAGACHPLGWNLCLALFVLVSRCRWRAARWPERAGRAFAGTLLAAVLAFAVAGEPGQVALDAWPALLLDGIEAMGWPVLVLALAGLRLGLPTSPALRIAIVVSLGLLPLLLLLGGDGAAPVAAAAVLPCLVAAATAVSWAAGALFRTAAPGTGTARVLAAVPMVVLASALAVDTFLYATVHQGFRPLFREAAHACLLMTREGAAGRVAADAGLPSLTYYMQPNHWQDRARPQPSAPLVVPLAWDAVGKQPLVPDGVDFVVLREDERRRVQSSAAGRTQLRQSFVLVEALPCPQPASDATLSLYRRVVDR